MKKTMSRFFIFFYKFLFQSYYKAWDTLQKQKENKFIFVLSRSKQLEGNLLSIYTELKKQKPEAELVIVSCQNKMNLTMFRELHDLSNASAVFLDDYYLPIYLIKPSPTLKVIQLWHAAGALKKFGHSTIGTKFGADQSYLRIVPIHSNYTHVYVSSHHIKKQYAEAFNMPIDRIHSFGLPRADDMHNDIYASQIKARLINTYPFLKDETVNILYAPTYRANGLHQESTFDVFKSIQQIYAHLNENKRLIVKLHPYMKTKIPTSFAHFITTSKRIVFDETYSLNDWMFVADAFVTDYSSAAFEFGFFKKPIFHYVPDYADYKKNRGLYNDIQDVSDGIVIETEEMLIQSLNRLSKGQIVNTERMIAINFDYTKDVAKRIVSHCLTENEGGFSI